MHVPQRKRPPPIDPSQRSRTTLPPDHVTETSAIDIFLESVEASATIEHRFSAKLEPLPHILWRYGRSIQALRYPVGRESSLPCSKSDVRACLVTAISMATKDVDAGRRLRAGYVQLEAFVADAEFEIVKELRDGMGDAAPSEGYDCSPEALQRLAHCRESAGTPARAILTRIAAQMLVRQRELGGSCP